MIQVLTAFLTGALFGAFPRMPRLLLVGALAAGSACSDRDERADGSRADASDPRVDGGTTETDAGRPDAGGIDASLGADGGEGEGAGFDAGSMDAGASDGGRRDGGPSDAGFIPRPTDAGPGLVVLESAYEAPTGPTGTSLLLSEDFWHGWRFEVTNASEVARFGYYADSGTGTVFGALIALEDGDDDPDEPDLSGDDVLELQTMPLSPTRGDLSLESAGTALEPGWYAVMFGTGAHGASSTGGNAVSGHAPVLGTKNPFTIRQTDGASVLQSRGPRFFVVLRPR